MYENAFKVTSHSLFLHNRSRNEPQASSGKRQSLILEDDTKSQQIKVWNHAPLPVSLEGKIVQIHSLQVTDFHSAQHDKTYKNIESLANVEIKVSLEKTSGITKDCTEWQLSGVYGLMVKR